MGYLFIIVLIALAAYAGNSSVIVISENDRAVVERTGKYHRTLEPGVQFVVPFAEKVVYVDTLRERILDIPPQQVLTLDSLTIIVDAVVYWQIVDIKKVYYEIENIEDAIASIVLTNMRSEIGRLNAKSTSSSKKDIDKALLKKLDETTSTWGAKVLRVEVQNITFPPKIQKAMEEEWAAISEKEAKIARAEAEKETAIAQAQAQAEAINLLAKSLGLNAGSPDFLNYLVATRFVDANEKLGQSSNSKILFVDPAVMSDSLQRLLGKRADFTEDDNDEPPPRQNGKKPLGGN